ncbi:MAG: substrate-binding domain-containing protein [Burkholderiales bacterium]|nr:substrate-binding domain-containing protein [Anaerolineae bacterium]
MRRGTIFLVVFVVLAVAVIGVSQFLRSQPPLEITLAVNPLAEAWVRDAMTSFNAGENAVGAAARRVQVQVISTDDPAVWQGESRWTLANHPHAWIPASSASVDYTAGSGGNLPFVSAADSLARTPLVWGGYASRVDALANSDAITTNTLDWQMVAEAAATDEGSWAALGGDANWRFLKVAFPRPDSTMSGLGALFSGAGYFNENATLTGGATRSREFQSAFVPIINAVPNFQTLGSDIAAAAARGSSTVEIALLPESQWLLNLDGITNNEDMRFSYPAYQFMLDFPLARWQSDTTTADEQAAVDAVANFLLSAAQQQNAQRFGLRPAQGEPGAPAGSATPTAAQLTQTSPLFEAALPYGIMLQPDYGQLVEAPTRSETLALLTWFANEQQN